MYNIIHEHLREDLLADSWHMEREPSLWWWSQSPQHRCVLIQPHVHSLMTSAADLHDKIHNSLKHTSL